MKFPMDFWAMRKKTLFFTGKESVMIARGSYKERILKICLNAELNGLLLLDEFQFIQGISTMLKLLTDKFGNLRILCSGSSSLDILQNIGSIFIHNIIDNNDCRFGIVTDMYLTSVRDCNAG